MKNSGFSTGKRYILQNRYFQEKCEKAAKKSAKILPKSTQNPSKIDQETKNIDKKSDADLRRAKKAKKMPKHAKKLPQDHPKGGDSKIRRPPRTLLQRGRSPSQGRNCESLMSRTSNTRWVRDPRALRPLRGDRRIPFGFRHVPLEAASVESSGV